MISTRIHNVLTVALAAVCSTASVAAANDSVTSHDERQGLTIGIGADIGHLECTGDYCDGVTDAYGLNAHLGLMMVPQLAVTGDVWFMGHTEDRLTVFQTMATVGPQVWLVPRLWVRAGFGMARASYNYDAEVVELMDSTEWKAAGMAAVGVEVLNRKNLALDVQLRAGTGLFGDGDTKVHNLSIGLGMSWF